jgi:drug/metabolite transporter (DMT)-like permease
MLASGFLLHESFGVLKLIGAGIVVLGLLVNVYGNQLLQVLKAREARV